VSAVPPRIVVGQGFTTRRYTVDSALRYVGGAVGFGFGAMWMTVGIGAAIACLLLAALGYGAVLVAERAQTNANLQRRPDEMYEVDADLPLMADELELSHTGLDQESYDPAPDAFDKPPVEAPRPLAAKADYGWPVG
jgi:hypothetical protein